MAQALKQKWGKMGSFLIENEGDNKEREKLTCRQTHHHHFRHFLQPNPLKEHRIYMCVYILKVKKNKGNSQLEKKNWKKKK